MDFFLINLIEVSFINNKMHIYKIYILMRLKNCAHPWKHHPIDDAENFYLPKKFPRALPQSISTFCLSAKATTDGFSVTTDQILPSLCIV